MAEGAALSAAEINRNCCRSSVVEHSLGKGEVGSSILPGSTIISMTYRKSVRRRIIGISSGILKPPRWTALGRKADVDLALSGTESVWGTLMSHAALDSSPETQST
jgi:hypothetical protein